MITKDQFAKNIVGNFLQQNNLKFEELNDNHVFMSSALAVGMNHLGLIKQDHIKKYAENRGGQFLTYVDDKDIAFLSVKEMIDMLPETVDN